MNFLSEREILNVMFNTFLMILLSYTIQQPVTESFCIFNVYTFFLKKKKITRIEEHFLKQPCALMSKSLSNQENMRLEF